MARGGFSPRGRERMNALRLFLVALCLVCPEIAFGQTPPSRGAARRATPAPGEGGKGQFRVCADPENLPFSNQRIEGFENRIADLIARDFGAKPTYIWWGQRRGFIRNTMNATLEEGRCDIVIGVPENYDLVLTTRPYYRSTYVFVYPKARGAAIRSLDDPVLKKLRIGVHLLGDDYTNPPPVHELSKRGVVGNLVGFSTFYSKENPPSSIVDAVASGRIDVAIVWGPAAGYFAARQRVPLQLVPVPSGKGDLPFTFGISMGVKPGNEALKVRLEKVLDTRQAEIAKILKDYGVPLLDVGPVLSDRPGGR
jgi:mxaJ protein